MDLYISNKSQTFVKLKEKQKKNVHELIFFLIPIPITSTEGKPPQKKGKEIP